MKRKFLEQDEIANKIKNQIENKLENKNNLFTLVPTETILKIFNYLSPKQLANMALICLRFNLLTNNMPRLTNIRTAFFNQNIYTLNKQLKEKYRNILDIIKKTYIDPQQIEHNMESIKTLIKHGAQINATEVDILQPLVFYYIKAVKNPHWITSIKEASLLKKIILFLLENKINVNKSYKDIYIVELFNFTALDYANKFLKNYPEMAAILQEYSDYNSQAIDEKNIQASTLRK